MATSVDALIEEVLHTSNPENLGMILVHRGVVRAFSKDGRRVKGMILKAPMEKIKQVEEKYSTFPGIEAVKVIVNTGELKVGDEIMTVVVAGRYRTDVIPVLEKVVAEVKAIVSEEELF